jgi:hypothetical protein
MPRAEGANDEASGYPAPGVTAKTVAFGGEVIRLADLS